MGQGVNCASGSIEGCILNSCGFGSAAEVRRLLGSREPDLVRPRSEPIEAQYTNMKGDRQRAVRARLKACEGLMRQMAMAGLDSREIAAAVGLNVSREAINRRLRKWGLAQPRGRKPWVNLPPVD